MARRAPQVVQPNAALPPTLNGLGKTRLTRTKVRTNAGQRARVSVRVVTAAGKPVKPSDFRVVTKDGVRWVEGSGRKALRVRVTMTAPRTKRFKAMREVKVYAVPKVSLPFAGELPGGPMEVFEHILDLLIDSVTGGIGDDLYGWATGALFASDKDGKDLQPILDKLNEISRQLDVLSGQIDKVEKEVHAASCVGITGATAAAVAHIQNHNRILKSMVQNKVKSKDLLRDWATQVTRAEGVSSDLYQLNLLMLGQGGSGGAIQECGKTFYDQWTQPLDEAGYYKRLWKYVGYFQQVQLLGLSSLVEGYHFLAVQQAQKDYGSIPAPKVIDKVCAKKTLDLPGDDVDFYCNQARDMTKQAYDAFVAQSVATGAAFGWNVDTFDGQTKDPAIAVQKGTDLLWVLDLNRVPSFQRNCGPGPVDYDKKKCPYMMRYSEYPYIDVADYGWMAAATSQQWADLLQTDKSPGKRISEIMESVGFAAGKTNKLIVYTGGSVSGQAGRIMQWLGGDAGEVWQPLATPAARGTCMFDSNFIAESGARWPICAQPTRRDDPPSAQFFTLLDQYTERRGEETGHYWVAPSKRAMTQGSDPAYYTGGLEADLSKLKSGIWWYQPLTITEPPGWLGRGYNPREKAYLWPVQDLGNTQEYHEYKCASLKLPGRDPIQLSAHNAGGARTMCGNDFVKWITAWLPKPP